MKNQKNSYVEDVEYIFNKINKIHGDKTKHLIDIIGKQLHWIKHKYNHWFIIVQIYCLLKKK